MPEINLLHVDTGAIGYGRLGVELAKSLRKQGVTVYDHLTRPGPEPVGESWWANKTPGVAETACWVSTPGHVDGWWEGQRPCIFTMWEATRLPEAFRDGLADLERVIVPSEQNQELFSDAHPDVRYVPLGIDPDSWYFQPRRPPNEEFRFLIAGGGVRKGADLAERAFRILWGREGSWGDGPVPTLTFKSPKGHPAFNSRMRVISGRIDPDVEIELYAQAHVYLGPARGEGFGLQPLQAIAQGCPTILTNAHGHASYAHLGWPLSTTLEKASYFIYGDAGDWWLPSLDEMVDYMADAYENYDKWCERAEESSQIVHDTMTWDHTASKFLDEIGELRPFDHEGKEWVGPEQTLFRMRVTKDWKCEVAGKVLMFDADTDYWVSAEVKRFAFESAVLDHKCVDDLEGVPAHTVEWYKRALSKCRTCGQPLNTEMPHSRKPVGSLAGNHEHADHA